MAVIGKIELQASQDVAAGTEASLSDVFSFEERCKKFEVSDDVRRDETKLTIHVAKLGVIESLSDANLPHGFQTSLATLMKWAAMNQKVKISDRIKKDETLEVSIEK